MNQRSFDVAGNFGSMTGLTGPGAGKDLGRHGEPNEAPLDLAEGGLLARMMEIVETSENSLSPGRWDERAVDSSRGVAEDEVLGSRDADEAKLQIAAGAA